MKKASKKPIGTQKRTSKSQEAHSKEGVREDRWMTCPDCREPMTQVLTVNTFKWACRCLPGIHFCE
jgi:acetyl-CoA carboxylase beta subunit